MLLNAVALAADHAYYMVHIFFAERLTLGFHHDTNQRLGTGFPDQDPAGISQLGGDFGNGGLYIGIVLAAVLSATRMFFSTWG